MIIKEIIKLCHKARIPLMLWGRHGVGKSSIVAQVCREEKMGCINFRCSQIEAVDLRGRPVERDGITAYLRPEELPIGGLDWDEAVKTAKTREDWVKIQPKLNNGILFLDELCRAQDDVLQAAFELAYDFKVGPHVLPPGWTVVSANNYFEGYLVNNFSDPAFLDRFCHVTVDPPIEAWAEYMIEQYGPEASKVVEFCTTNIDALEHKTKANIGFERTPSRRAWEMVVKVMQSAGGFSQDAVFLTIAGLVGHATATSFFKYDNPVKPQELLQKGVKEMENKLKKLTRTQLLGLTWSLVPHIDTKDDKSIDTVLDFVEWVITNTPEKDVVTGMLVRLIQKEGDFNCAKRAALSNKKVGAVLAEIEKKLGKTNTLIQAIQKRPELYDMISKVVWGVE